MTRSLVEENSALIRRRWPARPRAALVLGTGLGKLAAHISTEVVLPYRELHGFPVPTAVGHQGRVVCGTLAGVPLIAMQGRGHLYEGYSFDQVTLPVRVMQALGAELLIVSNASGGLNPQYQAGDIMAIRGHVNLMGRRGVGAQAAAAGAARDSPRQQSPYDPRLIDGALAIARRGNFVAHQGVYAAVCGPNYETRAECRFLRRWADAVGMSTVPEVTVAAAAAMRVLALSVITNVIRPDAPQHVSGDAVVATGAAAEPRLRQIVTGVLEKSQQ